jgi:hypothetical protein
MELARTKESAMTVRQTPGAMAPRSRRRRLSRYVRDPRGYGALRLTERDCRLLELLHDYRHLVVDHLQVLLDPGRHVRWRDLAEEERSRALVTAEAELLNQEPGAARWEAEARRREVVAQAFRRFTAGIDRKIYDRAAGLFHHGFIARFDPRDQLMEFRRGSQKDVLALDRRGAEVLCERRSAERVTRVTLGDLPWDRDYLSRTQDLMLHELSLSNARVIFEQGARLTPGLTLSEWDQTNCWGEVSLQDGRAFRLCADAYAQMRQNDRVGNLWIEVDNHTEDSKVITGKYHAYWHFLQSEAYRANYDAPHSVRVLFIVTDKARYGIARRDEDRLRSMMHQLAAMREPNDPKGAFAGKAAFWFACEHDFDVVEPERILTAKIWRTINRAGERRSLL